MWNTKINIKNFESPLTMLYRHFTNKNKGELQYHRATLENVKNRKNKTYSIQKTHISDYAAPGNTDFMIATHPMKNIKFDIYCIYIRCDPPSFSACNEHCVGRPAFITNIFSAIAIQISSRYLYTCRVRLLRRSQEGMEKRVFFTCFVSKWYLKFPNRSGQIKKLR